MSGVRRPMPWSVRGVTLIELMVAMVLGLIVTGAALALFVTNRQTYVASESLDRVQENARTAFELMSRDVREAAGNTCGAALANTVNVINTPTANWYTDFSGGIRGYDAGTTMPGLAVGTATGNRVAGTDGIDLKSMYSGGATIKSHDPAAFQITVNTSAHGLKTGDLAMACDSNHGAIFQVTSAASGVSGTIEHKTGAGTPGNSTAELGAPLGSRYQFGCKFGGVPSSGVDCTVAGNKWTASLMKLKATRWYVGCNGRLPCSDPRGRSLYLSTVQNTGGNLSVVNNEITEGVADMTLSYLADDGTSYTNAATVADWTKIVAVDINLDMIGQDKIGTDAGALTRNLDHVVTFRNREQ